MSDRFAVKVFILNGISVDISICGAIVSVKILSGLRKVWNKKKLVWYWNFQCLNVLYRRPNFTSTIRCITIYGVIVLIFMPSTCIPFHSTDRIHYDNWNRFLFCGVVYMFANILFSLIHSHSPALFLSKNHSKRKTFEVTA